MTHSIADASAHHKSQSDAPLAFRRVLLKVSGEALMGDQGYGLHSETMSAWPRRSARSGRLASRSRSWSGGGNIFRGLAGAAGGMERTSADSMGMLATVINALALQSALQRVGVDATALSAIPMPTVCEPYAARTALRRLEEGAVVICAAGTGNPFFTTDTAATLRALELKCDAFWKGTQVDGVYDADPRKNPDAKRYEEVSYDEVLVKNLNVMDMAAIALARDNALPVIVFSLTAEGGLPAVAQGRARFTRVTR